MGGTHSKKNKVIKMINSYVYHKQGVVAEKQFVECIFKGLDNIWGHSEVGSLIVVGSHILKQLYEHMIASDNNILTFNHLLKFIEKIYNQPQKAIEYSYSIIKKKCDKTVSRQQFVDFVLNSYDQGIASILKHSQTSELFKTSFMLWVSSNRELFAQETNRIFTQNARVESDIWTLGDFKRWILDKQHWMIYISLSDEIYRIPLNIPCLFGIKIDQQ